MNLTKDMYEYLANFADDKDIVNMLSVNKKFNDPIFFERIFKRKYPLLVKFKNENETWKHFYLRMIKSIAKLNEQYHIPYIPHVDFNPEEFYVRYSRGLGKIHAQRTAVFYAISINDQKIVEKILRHVDKRDFGSILYDSIYSARSRGKTGMLKFLENFEKKSIKK